MCECVCVYERERERERERDSESARDEVDTKIRYNPSRFKTGLMM